MFDWKMQPAFAPGKKRRGLPPSGPSSLVERLDAFTAPLRNRLRRLIDRSSAASPVTRKPSSSAAEAVFALRQRLLGGGLDSLKACASACLYLARQRVSNPR